MTSASESRRVAVNSTADNQTILTCKTEIEQLQLELHNQRKESDCSIARLRAELAEAVADARSLRVKCAKLFPNEKISDHCSENFSHCVNCVKLEKLNKILQDKLCIPSDPEAFVSVAIQQTSSEHQEQQLLNTNDLIVLKDKYDELEHALDEKDSYLEKLVQEKSRLSSRIDELSDHLHAAISDKKNLQDMHQELEKDFEDRYETLLSKHQQLSKENQDINSRIMQSKSEVNPQIQSIEHVKSSLNDVPSASVVQVLYNQYKSDKAHFDAEKRRWLEEISRSSAPTQVSLSESEQIACLTNQLVKAKEEIALAEDQLKGNNVEFLNIREKIAFASTEREILKSTINDFEKQERDKIMKDQCIYFTWKAAQNPVSHHPLT